MKLNLKKDDVITVLIPCLLFLLSLLFYLCRFIEGSMLVLMLLFINNIIFSLCKYEKHFVFFIFNGCFFTFLLGHIFIAFLSGNGVQLNYSFNINLQIIFLLILSLFGLFIGYYLYQKKNQREIYKHKTNNAEQKFGTLMKICMYVCTVPHFCEIIEKIIFVQNNSYIEYYTGFSSSLPYIVLKLSSLYTFFFIMFAACRPNRKEFKIPAFLFIFSGALMLGYGQRNTFVLNIIFITIYCFLKNLEMPVHKKWLTKRMLVLGCLCIPFIIAFLFIFQSMRYNAVTNTSFFESLIGFFDSQGASVNVIGEGIKYQEQLPNVNYSLGPLITSLNNNKIIHQLFDTKILTPYTVEMATEGHIFAHSLTYLWNPNLYLQGGGMGSCYIIELYHDYSYIGVIICNILLGSFLGFLSQPKKGIFGSACSLLLMKGIFFLPRDSATGFLANAFSFTNLMMLLILFIIYKFVVKNMKTNEVKKTLVLLTNCFPYTESETFLEPEISYYKKFDCVYCIPEIYSINGLTCRPIPYHVVTFRKHLQNFIKMKSLLLCLFESEMWLEILKLIRHKELTKPRFKQIISLSYHGELLYQLIYREIGANLNDDTVYYSYWLNSQAIAAIKLNRLYSGSHAVSRAHGIDLYAYRNSNNYQALREYLKINLDRLYFNSRQGMNYFIDNYGNNDNLFISYLGTENNYKYCKREKGETFHIVSCSSLISLKRVHLIIQALEKVKSTNIKWTHIGEGELYENIKALAAEKIGNIEYEFLGRLTNREVLNYYKKNNVGVFINVSEFEGLPVSIIECMSFGIPVIGTDVGAVNEIIKNGINGFLLRKDFDSDELARHIEYLNSLDDDSYNKFRKSAYETWQMNFCAKNNYERFIKDLVGMIEYE